MKLKRAGLAAKLVIVIVLAALSVMLLDLRGQIAELQSRKAVLQQQVSEQAQVNADLRAAVEQSGDEESERDIARSELGLVEPGETLFRIAD